MVRTGPLPCGYRLQLYIPPVDGKPITAHVPGFESENINVAGQSPNMG
jgi:hypothetical protein